MVTFWRRAMAPDPDFEFFQERLRSGDAEAVNQLLQRFAARLIYLARQRLDGRIRQKVDPEEVVQSVWKSFLLRHADGQFELHSWDALWSLLTCITLRKCGYRTRYFRRACRDVQREASPAADEDDPQHIWQAIAREPTPDEGAVLAETVEQLLRDLDEQQRQIVELTMQGYKAPEISAQLPVSERTVYRLLERVKRRLEKLSGDGAFGE
jgi:RNA polymerase sigma factor (sigma-70 family)